MVSIMYQCTVFMRLLGDDVMLQPSMLNFNSGNTSMCFNVTIRDDDGPEPSQYFDIVYSLDSQSSNVVLSASRTRVTIAG